MEYAEKLAQYANEQLGQVNKINEEMKSCENNFSEAQSKKEGGITYIIEDMKYFNFSPLWHGSLYAPIMENPLSWATSDWNQRQYNEEELLLHNCVILSITHDEIVDIDESKIYNPQTYQGKYFNVARLFGINWSFDRIKRANDSVKPSLDKWLKNNKQQGNTEENKTEEKGEEVKTKLKQESDLEPKAPEILQKILWVLLHGKKYWKLILLALLILFISSIFIWPQFNIINLILRLIKLIHF